MGVTYVSKNCVCGILAAAVVAAGVVAWCHVKPTRECCDDGVQIRGGSSAWDVPRHASSDWRLTTLRTHDTLSRTPCNHRYHRFSSVLWSLECTIIVGADQGLALHRQWDAGSFELASRCFV